MLAPLRQLLPSRGAVEQWAGGVGARAAAWDRTTLLLGASGVGIAVLGALLFSSRQQNQCASLPACLL